MAEKLGGADQFANIAAIRCIESVANTLTFKKLETGVSLFEKIAWVLHRLEYYHDNTATTFAATGDTLTFGLATSDQIITPTGENAAVLDYEQVERQDMGAAANGSLRWLPLVKDLTNLPSGGIIVPPNPLYLWVKGVSLPVVGNVMCRIFYTTVKLTPDQYWELVEARRIIAS